MPIDASTILVTGGSSGLGAACVEQLARRGAAVIVAGFRWPALWAIPLLTKVTPGGIGLLWFAARGEWRHLGIALASTLAIVVVT